MIDDLVARGRSDPFAPDGALADTLRAAVGVIGIDIRSGLESDLLCYLKLLYKWNGVYNLSAIRDPESMLTHHLLDSLAILPTLMAAGGQGSEPLRLVDVGSGAGLPGIPLALAWPGLVVHLVEPVGKKAAFLRQCAVELSLSGRLFVHAEAITFVQDLRPHHIICRAFASLTEFVAGIDRQMTSVTRIWAMKGRYPHDEVAALPAPWRVIAAHPISVPGLDAQRHLIELSRNPLQSVEL